MTDMERIFRGIGLAEAIESADDLRLKEDLRRLVMTGGKVDPRALPGYVRMLDYTVGTTLPQRAGRAGTLTLASVRCGTAPSTGDAVITVTRESELSGIETFPVTVPSGNAYGDEVMAVSVNASDWFGVAVSDAEGASSVSASLTITIGGS